MFEWHYIRLTEEKHELKGTLKRAEIEHQAGVPTEPFLKSVVSFHSSVDGEWLNFKENITIFPFS